MAVPPWLVVKAAMWWHKFKPLRRLGIRKEKAMLQGKLTYSSLAVLALVWVGQWLGVEVAESEWTQLVEAAALALGVFGRWRATK